MGISRIFPPILSPALRLMLPLALLLGAVSLAWVFHDLPENGRAFILKLRLIKLVGLITVGAAVATGTVLFQTVAANRVLTPSIMGFDALYMLLQTSLVAALGTAGFAAIPAGGKFLFEVGMLCALAMVLFGTLLGNGARDIPRTILTGVILGILFRSANSFLSQILDPDTFASVQAAQFASFNAIDATILPWATAICLFAIAAAIRLGPQLDVLALGRGTAVPLGLRYSAITVGTLALVGILVSVSTALVGPVTFFGLIVAGLAHGMADTVRHRALLPLAALISANILVIGQFVFERIAGLSGTLSVVIEFLGGLFFLYLLLKGRVR